MTHPASILIVDDDPAICSGVSALLVQAGYQTASVTSGIAALEWLAQHPLPNLIILDIILPGIDGYTVCRRIRQMPTYVPILMLSVRDQVHERIIGLELGADDYLTKPFVPLELVARVKALLRFVQHYMTTTTHSAAEQPLEYGLIQLWRGQHRVLVAGQEVTLTPKEWQVLVVLMEHAGQVVGRETLLRRVWGDTADGDTRLVDTQVQRLRSKLEAYAADGACIQTIRGFGYRLIDA